MRQHSLQIVLLVVTLPNTPALTLQGTQGAPSLIKRAERLSFCCTKEKVINLILPRNTQTQGHEAISVYKIYNPFCVWKMGGYKPQKEHGTFYIIYTFRSASPYYGYRTEAGVRRCLGRDIF